MFRVKRFALNHLSKSVIMDLPVQISSFMLENSKYMAVSSAKILILPSMQQFARSFRCKMNSRGPSTEPCGTPQLMGKTVDLSFLFANA